MFHEEKKKQTNYASICLLFFFCCVFGVEVVRFAKTYTNPTALEPTLTAAAVTTEVAATSDAFSCNLTTKTASSSGNVNKLSARVDIWRELPPSSYCVKVASFTKLADKLQGGRFESRPFVSGGYNWSLIMYPKGNKEAGVSGWVSLYVKIDNSTLIQDPRDVYAQIRFSIYNRNENKYYTYHESEPRRFHLFSPEWGIPSTQSYDIVRSPPYGWVFDGDQFVFGVDVFVAPNFDKWEVSSFAQNFHEPKYTWELRNFSTRYNEFYVSEEFSRGERNWYLKLYPGGDGVGRGNSLSLYVVANNTEPNVKVYLRANLRILDQRNSSTKHMEKQVDSWSDTPGLGWGFPQFISFADLNDSSKGYIVGDKLKVEVEFLEFSKTDYYPS